MAKSNTKWEMQSINNFVEQLLDEDRETYTRNELLELTESLNLQPPQVVYQLDCLGIKSEIYKAEKKFRTYKDNDNNLWDHPDMKCGAY